MDVPPVQISKKKRKRQEYQQKMFELTGMNREQRKQHNKRQKKMAKMNPGQIEHYLQVHHLTQEYLKIMSQYPEISHKYHKDVATHLANHVIGNNSGSAWGWEDDIGMIGEAIFAHSGVCPSCGEKLTYSNNSTPLGDFWCSQCQHYIELKTTTHERPVLVLKPMNVYLFRILCKVPALLEKLKCRWMIITYLDREKGILTPTRCFDIRHIITIIGENKPLIEMIDNGDFKKCLLEFKADGQEEIVTFNFV
jgi:hypothetical protein